MIDSILSPLLMAVEILAADYIFGLLLTRRSRFALRAVVSSVVALEVIVLFWLGYYGITGSFFSYNSVESWVDSVYKFVLYLVIFVMTVACIRFTFKNSIWIILFYCSGGYAIQHISVNVASLIRAIPPVGAAVAEHFWISYLIDLAVCAVAYTVLYFLFVHRKYLSENAKGIKNKVFVSVFVILICIVLSRLTTDDTTRGTAAFLAETLYAILSCSLILFTLFSLAVNDRMQDKVDMVTELLYREREQYKLVKENIDLINIKCHDLKHQIAALRNDSSETNINKIEQAVMIYDAVVKTGNDVLDTVLTEKSLYCEKHRIRLTCMVHAEAISFMSDMDIYSLFGNALSNAIESVSKIENEARRVISMSVQTNRRFLSVHIENFYEGEIEMKNGLPETDKDKGYHGFGMKSMSFIARQYNGHMTVSAENGVFKLDFIFPLSEGEELPAGE